MDTRCKAVKRPPLGSPLQREAEIDSFMHRDYIDIMIHARRGKKRNGYNLSYLLRRPCKSSTDNVSCLSALLRFRPVFDGAGVRTVGGGASYRGITIHAHGIR